MCSSLATIYEIVIYNLTVGTIMKYSLIATVYVTYYIVTEMFLSSLFLFYVHNVLEKIDNRQFVNGKKTAVTLRNRLH